MVNPRVTSPISRSIAYSVPLPEVIPPEKPSIFNKYEARSHIVGASAAPSPVILITLRPFVLKT